jgi:predicted transcriptional regulator
MIPRGFTLNMATNLAEQEKVILDIVHDYLDKNRQFTFEEIIPFIISRVRLASLNINKEGVKTVLKSLTNKKFLVEGSKLAKIDVLNNQKRRRIYEYIVKNPGIYFNRIVTELNYSNHIVVWHLNMLIKFDFVHKEVLENHEVYFDATKEFDEIVSKYFISKEKSKEIINFLQKDDIGVTKTSLSHELSMHMNTLAKYLDILEKYDVIVKKKIDNRNLYFLNEK